MTCDCHDHDCSTSTDVGGSSAFGRIEQALSDPSKLGYVALMSGGTLAWYAMPDFVRSRPVRGVLKAGLLGGITAALASMFSCEDHRAFVGNCDEGGACACCNGDASCEGKSCNCGENDGCGCGKGQDGCACGKGKGKCGCGSDEGAAAAGERTVPLIDKDQAGPLDPNRTLEPEPHKECDCQSDGSCGCTGNRHHDGQHCDHDQCGCSTEHHRHGDHRSGHHQALDTLQETLQENPALIGAAVGITAVTTAATVWIEKTIFRRGENRRAAGKRCAHTDLAALMAALVAGMETAHVSGLLSSRQDAHCPHDCEDCGR